MSIPLKLVSLHLHSHNARRCQRIRAAVFHPGTTRPTGAWQRTKPRHQRQPRTLSLTGIVQKHGGERTVWIDGVPKLAVKAMSSRPKARRSPSRPLETNQGQGRTKGIHQSRRFGAIRHYARAATSYWQEKTARCGADGDAGDHGDGRRSFSGQLAQHIRAENRAAETAASSLAQRKRR